MKFFKAIAAIILIISVTFVGCKKEKTVDELGGNGHEYVDLGLPSGTLWATCNLGADSPEDIGDYYAWGETAAKDVYDWKTYRYCVYVNGCYEMTKYCIADGLTVLEPGDDAARASWGDNWRMPTREEWEELYQNTSCIAVTQNGVDGMLLTGMNGNSIFLPTTGYRIDNELVSDALGIYWSSTLQTTFYDIAWSFHFTSTTYHVCGTYERSRGQVVRAVKNH